MSSWLKRMRKLQRYISTLALQSSFAVYLLQLHRYEKDNNVIRACAHVRVCAGAKQKYKDNALLKAGV